MLSIGLGEILACKAWRGGLGIFEMRANIDWWVDFIAIDNMGCLLSGAGFTMKMIVGRAI